MGFVPIPTLTPTIGVNVAIAAVGTKSKYVVLVPRTRRPRSALPVNAPLTFLRT